MQHRHTCAVECWGQREDLGGATVCDITGCEISVGYCHCGCGELAPIAKKSATRYGHAKGQPVRFINGHYQRTTRLSPVDYLVDEAAGCWVWQRFVGPSGYGNLRDSRRMRPAHRVYYERLRGAIPEGLVLDHLCRNRACVNPDHLEPVTHRENILRGNTIAARRAAQTHCIHGHPFTEENTIRGPRGRNCRTCQQKAVREANRQRNARLRADPALTELRRTRRSRSGPQVDYLIDPVRGCWNWQGHLTVDGYGLKRRDGRKIGAHRFYYELHEGPIPEGLMLDHLCHNPACVNPAHLEPVTVKENARRRRPRSKGNGVVA